MPVVMSFLPLVGIAAIALFGLVLRRRAPITLSVATARDELSSGHAKDAEAILDAIPPGRGRPEYRRAIEILRAEIALRRGDLERAVVHATQAIEARTGLLALLLSPSAGQAQIVAAYAVRAVAAASRDDRAAASADIGVVRASPVATPGLLSLVSLAEAITLSRANDRDGLAALLARDRKLLLEFTPPRERALVRALRRTLYVRAGSAYREPGVRELPPPSELATWISTVAPATAGLTSSDRAVAFGAARLDVDAPSHSRAAATSSARPGGPIRVPLVSQLALIVAMITIVGSRSFFGREAPASDQGEILPPRADVHGSSFPILLVVVVFIAAAVAVAFFVVAQRRGARKLREACRLLALADLAPAERALSQLATGIQLPSVGGRAVVELAMIAARRAQFAEGLTLVDRALMRAAHPMAMMAGFIPLLRAQRAYLLAALDRPSEALAALAALAETFAMYPSLAPSQIITRTILAVRTGDAAGGWEVAAQRTSDSPMSLYDETLVDVLAVAADARPEEPEVERLRGDLRTDPELRVWLRAVWPGAEDALEEARARAA